jgi:hypothetical protein
MLVVTVIVGVNCGGSTDDSGECPNEPTFYCVAFCGGDLEYDPECSSGKWACPKAYPQRDDKCPVDTCWGPPPGFKCCEPGSVNGIQPECVEGEFQCPSGTSKLTAGKCPGCEVTGCSENEFCSFEDCGKESGTCKVLPEICDDSFAPLCGCDGVIYPNACRASMLGIDVGPQCTPGPDNFLCGARICRQNVDYCQVRQETGVEAFACLPLPRECGSSPSCSCLSNEPCGEHCSGEEGTLKLTCNLGE